MYMEAMRASAPDKRAVVSGKLTIRTTTVEGHTTNAAVIVVSYPTPRSNPGPTLNKVISVN